MGSLNFRTVMTAFVMRQQHSAHVRPSGLIHTRINTTYFFNGREVRSYLNINVNLLI